MFRSLKTLFKEFGGEEVTYKCSTRMLVIQ